jgi:glycosyltransferase involved in cell wall biosynthesis
VVPSLPLPPRGGADLRNWENVKGLLSLGPVAVFGLAGAREEPPAEAGIEVWRVSRDPTLGCRIGLAIGSSEWPEGHPSDAYYSPAVVRELEEIVGMFEPDLVVLELLLTHHYIDALGEQGMPIVLDAHNIEGPLAIDLAAAAVGGREARLRRATLAERLVKIESAAFERADQVWVPSERDARLAVHRYGTTTPIEVVPNALDVDSYAGPPAGDEERLGATDPTVVLTARFDYPPNAIAARFLVEEVLPRLWERLPSARLQLVGSSPTGLIRAAAAQEPRIEVTGPVPEVTRFLARAFAVVVPLFHGGGTRLKVLEAFAAGTPVVATMKAVEGLDAVEGAHLVAAESADEFVAALVALWTDQARAAGIAARAQRLVRERYSREVVCRCVASAIRTLDASTRGTLPGGQA